MIFQYSFRSDPTLIIFPRSFNSFIIRLTFGMWFNYGVLNDFMKEWVLRKEELKSGEITRDEYFEWKINWPQTCDGCGKFESKRQWRSVNAELSET